MKRSLTILLLLSTAVALWAAPRALTVEFSGLPLVQAIQTVEREMGYTIIYNSAELDGQRLVSARFENADIYEVLNTLLGERYTYVVKSTLVTIQPAMRASSPRRPQAPSPKTRMETRYRDSITSHVDTTYVTSMIDYFQTKDTSWQQPAAEQPVQQPSEASHRLMVGAGVGYGQMGLKMQDEDGLRLSQWGSVAGQMDVSYAYFWNRHWGVSLGLGLDYYGGHVEIDGNRDYATWTDTDQEPCTWQVICNQLNEKQKAFVFDLPVMLHLEWLVQNAGIYAAAGVRMGVPVFTQYKGVSGEVIYRGWYDKWHLMLDQVHDYNHDANYRSGQLSLAPITAAVQAEAGALIPLPTTTLPTTLRIGVYGNVVANNALSTGRQQYFTPEGCFYPDQYAGVMQVGQTRAAHPWQVGVKATLTWQWPKRQRPLPVVYETIQRTDTTWLQRERTDTVLTTVMDTIHIAEQVTITEAVSTIELEKPDVYTRDEVTVVLFEIDKAMPKAGTEEALDSIAMVLRQHPDWQIEVSGHACTIGNREYNDRLSLRRAQSVATLLSIRGVKEEQMIVRGYGSSRPTQPGEHDLSHDRRVEIQPIINHIY